MKFRHFILAFSILGLISCERDVCITEYETFTAEEKAWLAYDIGDTLIYESDTGDLDTFVVYTQETNNYKPIDPGYSPGRECYHPISGKYKMFNRDSTLHAELSLTKDRTLHQNFHQHPRIGNFSTNLNFTDPIDKLTINGTDYQDVYVIVRDIFYEDDIINSIKFNKDFGFIQYEMMDGTLWTLDEIIRK